MILRREGERISLWAGCEPGEEGEGWRREGGRAFASLPEVVLELPRMTSGRERGGADKRDI